MNLLLLCFALFCFVFFFSVHILYIIVVFYLSPSPRDFRRALALPSIGRPLGRCLAQFPRLCYWLTFLTLTMEVAFPMLVCGWSAFWWRCFVSGVFGVVCVCVIVYCDVVGFDVGIAPGSGTTIYPRLHPPIYHSLKKPIADSLTHSLTH